MAFSSHPFLRPLCPAALAAAVILSACKGEPVDIPVDERPIDRAESLTPKSYALMLEGATPSVVAVYTARIVRVVRSSGPRTREDELYRRFFGLPYGHGSGELSVEERKLPQGVGSGVILTGDGYIVTNNHVVTGERGDEADEVLVRLSDGRELPAEIVGRDPGTDVAILKVDAEGLPAIEVADSENARVGDVVFAIGNPLGVGLTVTQGIISATERALGIYGEEGYENFIQTDASINLGNSGGALVDADGRLIGVNSAILSPSRGNIGLGFAIPSNLALNVTRQLIDNGRVRRGYLGLSVSSLGPDMAEAFGVPDTSGVLVEDVAEGSPADSSGVRRGDVITELAGRPIESANEYRVAIAQSVPGTEVEALLLREGEPVRLTLEMGDREVEIAAQAGEIFDGVTVQTVTEGTREDYDIPPQVRGLLVTSVDPRSPYRRHIEAGLVVMEINNQAVSGVDAARGLLEPGYNRLYVYNRGRTGYLAVRMP